MALKNVQQAGVFIKSDGILAEHKSIVHSACVQSNIVLLNKLQVESRETEGSGVPLWEEEGGEVEAVLIILTKPRRCITCAGTNLKPLRYFLDDIFLFLQG